MKKSIKSLLMMLCVTVMVITMAIPAFAAGGFHKVNGAGSENGRNVTYTSRTTMSCRRITAKGTSDNNRKEVVITITSSSGKVVYSGTVRLNGQEQPLVNFYTAQLDPDVYTINVNCYDQVPYEVSTYFYR